jgi:hypothetical protein
MRRGAWAWFDDGWTCGAKVPEYWMVSSLKIKLNRSWKFRRNWNVPLVLLERLWWAGLNGIYLVRFGFRMWEILIFKWFLLLNIQINSQKPGFGRKNQLRTLCQQQRQTLVILISCVRMDPNNETTGPGTSLLGFCERDIWLSVRDIWLRVMIMVDWRWRLLGLDTFCLQMWDIRVLLIFPLGFTHTIWLTVALSQVVFKNMGNLPFKNRTSGLGTKDSVQQNITKFIGSTVYN